MMTKRIVRSWVSCSGVGSSDAVAIADVVDGKAAAVVTAAAVRE